MGSVRRCAAVFGMLLSMWLCGAGGALADDARLYQQPFVWTGTTFGLQGTYGMGNSTWYKGLLDGTPEGRVDYNGVNVGAFMGMTYQTAWGFVVGGELSFARGQTGKAACSIVAGANCVTNLDWYVTPSARLGYAWGNLLVYGKVGVGLLDLVHQLRDSAAVPFSNARSMSFAPLYGGGIDYALTSNVITGIEYNRVGCDVKLNHFNAPDGSGVAGADIDTCFSDVRVKLGIKY